MSSAEVPRPTIYLESRYRKLVRGLPQTIHYCPRCKGDPRRSRRCATCAGRGRLSPDSVQQILDGVLLPAFGARAGKFHGAGREDVDVLMLGQGRPFVYEVIGAEREAVDLAALLAEVHAAAAGRVEFAPLQRCDRARVPYWKGVELEKTYRVRVALLGPLPGPPDRVVGQRFAIEQRTPERVAHRRGDLVRSRWVQVLAVDQAGAAALDVVLRCAHGTYVKEWISGDAGRTRPAFADLVGVAARCETLDVIDVAAVAATDPAPDPAA